MRGEDIADRLVEVAARVIKVVDALPDRPAGKHLAGQLLRCGTAPGAHYEEARGGESSRDFIHKLALARKELQETRYWLRVAGRASLVSERRLSDLLIEVDALCRILGKSLLTAKSGGNRRATSG